MKEIGISNRDPSTSVEFRSKFTKLINELPGNVRKKIENTIIAFRDSEDDDFCSKSLWQLTYAPAKILKVMKFAIEPSTLPTEEFARFNDYRIDETVVNSTFIPFSLVLPLRNELRYQRANVHPHFLEISNLPESCKQAYTELSNALSADSIVTTTVYNACYTLCQHESQEYIERSLYLLESSNDSYIFGGIRSLHFNREEADYLKPYAQLLHNLLTAIWNEALVAKQALHNTPLAALSTLLDDNDIPSEEEDFDIQSAKTETTESVKPETVETETAESVETETVETETAESEMPVVESHDVLVSETPLNIFSRIDEENIKTLNATNILTNATIFEGFLSACEKLVTAGYNPAEVIEKAAPIHMILHGSKLLDS